jgi:uncharacterized protein YecE (DUF72 family)
MALYIGTSGWAYPEWRGSKDNSGRPGFYPEAVPQTRWLEHYAKHLSACEVNATFYRIQPSAAVSRWGATTPAHFRFAAKSHRALTHSSSVSPRGPLRTLLDEYVSSLSPLGTRLRVILLQFPRHRSARDADVVELLSAVGERMSFAAEFSHDACSPDVADACAAAGGTLCLSEHDGGAPDSLAPGSIAYVRLRAQRYPEDARHAWSALLQAEGQRRDVFVFARHKGLDPNDAYGGLGLARWLEWAARETHVSGRL